SEGRFLGADFRRATLKGVNWSGAVLQGALFDPGSPWGQSTIFYYPSSRQTGRLSYEAAWVWLGLPPPPRGTTASRRALSRRVTVSQSAGLSSRSGLRNSSLPR